MYSAFEMIYLGLAVVFSIPGIFYLVRSTRKIKKNIATDYKWINKALLAFILFGITVYIFRWVLRRVLHMDSPFDSIVAAFINSPFNLALSTIPVVLGIWLCVKLNIISFTPSSINSNTISEHDLNNKVKELWESHGFLTAFKTVLPQGKKDDEYGLDYIPFMLQNIDERRIRYKSSSELFLKVTIVLGVLFSMLVVYFGYILVNDDSVGISKSISNIEEVLIDTQEALLNGTSLLEKNQLTGHSLISDIDRIEKYLRESNEEYYKKIGSLKFRVTTVTELSTLAGQLKEFKELNTQIKNDELSLITQLIDKVIKNAVKLSNGVSNSKSILAFKIDVLNRYTSDIKSEINNNDFRINELIKRLAVGLIVASFFLAILRYISLIYKEHHSQMLKAEMDELAIRKYYVAFKSSSDIESLKKESIASLFDRNFVPSESKEGGGFSKEEAGIVKELLSLLSKKIA